jgi:hypothetical protein
VTHEHAAAAVALQVEGVEGVALGVVRLEKVEVRVPLVSDDLRRNAAGDSGRQSRGPLLFFSPVVARAGDLGASDRASLGGERTLPHVKQRTGMIIARDQTNREARRRTARRSSGADCAPRSGDAEGQTRGADLPPPKASVHLEKKPGRAPRAHGVMRRRRAAHAWDGPPDDDRRQYSSSLHFARARVRPSSGWNGAARGHASPGTGGSASAVPGSDARARLRVSASRRARPADW